jgi:hypothetical protein
MRDEKDDQMTHWRMVAARGIVRNYGQIWANNNSPATSRTNLRGRCYSCHFDSHAGRRLNQNFTRRVEIRRLGTMSQMFDYRTNRDLTLGNRRVPVENDFIVPRRGVRVYAGRYSWAEKKIPVHFSDDSLT